MSKTSCSHYMYTCALIYISYTYTYAYTAVVGAGHLEGVQKWLAQGGVTEERIAEISGSSKQGSTWPGTGVLQVRS